MSTTGVGAVGFPHTRWTLILSAQKDPSLRRAALNQLLSTYWRPLYIFLRRKGLPREPAQDAVQDLMTSLLERDVLDRLDPARGRLRAYLRTAVQNHVSHHREKTTAAKRGGPAALSPVELEDIELQLASHEGDPERAYEQAWAAQVMEGALSRLRAEFERGERKGPFDVVQLFFGAAQPPSYREVAHQHGMTLPQLKAFLHRARARFGELLREEVADTAAPSEVDAELKDLLAVLH